MAFMMDVRRLSFPVGCCRPAVEKFVVANEKVSLSVGVDGATDAPDVTD